MDGRWRFNVNRTEKVDKFYLDGIVRRSEDNKIICEIVDSEDINYLALKKRSLEESSILYEDGTIIDMKIDEVKKLDRKDEVYIFTPMNRAMPTSYDNIFAVYNNKMESIYKTKTSCTVKVCVGSTEVGYEYDGDNYSWSITGTKNSTGRDTVTYDSDSVIRFLGENVDNVSCVKKGINTRFSIYATEED